MVDGVSLGELQQVAQIEFEAGNITEECYNAMKEIINRKYPDKINLRVEGAGNNTLNLFQDAKNLVAASANGYKHVWVVFKFQRCQVP